VGTLYYPDGRIEEVSPENGETYQLEELHRLLDCAMIDVIPTRNGTMMVIDDEGKLNGKLRNEAATQLINFKSPAEIAKEILRAKEMGFRAIYMDPDPPDTSGYIAGTALVCEPHEVD